MAIDPRIDRTLAGQATDPLEWAWTWSLLPNPDAVLRRLGRDQEAYDLMLLDAHVMGEVRSIRAGLLALEWRLEPGGDGRRERRAWALCSELMQGDPAPGRNWDDVRWTIAQAALRGHSVHEVVWRREGAAVLPTVIDRPNRRFRWGRDRELRLLTKASPLEGEPVDEGQFLVARHMPSDDNPYGVAVLSSCWWPWSFKRIGWTGLVRFSRRFGLPWPVGKYQQGDPVAGGRAESMVRQMMEMLDSGVIALPEDESVEFLEASTSSSGQLPQERLVSMANREMSKALTSQTLATEIEGQGSRAASETHHDREREVQRADRSIVRGALNRLLRWTTDANFGTDVAAPRWEWVDAPPAERDWAETLDVARRYVEVPSAFAHERLGIPMPKDSEATLDAGADPVPGGDPLRMSRCPGCGASRFALGRAEDDAFERGLQALEAAAEGGGLDRIGRDLAGPIVDAARADPEALLGGLAELHPRMDADALQDRLARLIFTAETWARLSVDG